MRELRLLEHFGMTPSSHVLDVGCGIGRLAYECASYLDDDVTYTGLDIAPAAIEWLNINYASQLHGFRFDLLDVYNESYRPNGSVRPEHVTFPFQEATFDVVCAFEVFMHVSLEGVRNYLGEMARVLRPGGLAVFSFVGVHPGEPPSLQQEYTRVDDGIYTASPGRSSSNMAYGIDLIRSAVSDAGLDEVGFTKGRMHTPVESRPGIAPGVELPPIWHPCDVIAARKRASGAAVRARRARWRPHSRRSAPLADSVQTARTVDITPDSGVMSVRAVPGAPTVLAVTPGDEEITVSWTEPASTGDSPIIGYAVTVYSGLMTVKTRIFHSTATTGTVTGLANGEPYELRVRAYNAIGIGPYSRASEPTAAGSAG